MDLIISVLNNSCELIDFLLKDNDLQDKELYDTCIMSSQVMNDCGDVNVRKRKENLYNDEEQPETNIPQKSRLSKSNSSLTLHDETLDNSEYKPVLKVRNVKVTKVNTKPPHVTNYRSPRIIRNPLSCIKISCNTCLQELPVNVTIYMCNDNSYCKTCYFGNN